MDDFTRAKKALLYLFTYLYSLVTLLALLVASAARQKSVLGVSYYTTMASGFAFGLSFDV